MPAADNGRQGLVICADKGLYHVESLDGVFLCSARGALRNADLAPLVGDRVLLDDKVISTILPRRNSLIRPPLANLDALVFVVSTCSPSPNYLLLDKFIAICRFKGIEPMLALTKLDLADYAQLCEIYSATDIRIFNIDYSAPEPAAELIKALSGRFSAFTGNSGVGKSTLLNAIDAGFDIPTGEISRKLGRGRHTTRRTMLYKLPDGGYIADTPGFSTFDTNRYDIIRKEELAECFGEFEQYIGKCRFSDCSHTAESGCEIIAAVERGEINRSRYESYRTMYEQAKQLKEWEIAPRKQ